MHAWIGWFQCVFVNWYYGISDAPPMPTYHQDGFTVRDFLLWDFQMQYSYSEDGFSFGYWINKRKLSVAKEAKHKTVLYSRINTSLQVRYIP